MIGFRLPTHVHIEPGALGQLPTLLAKPFAARSVLLIVDPGLSATPWPQAACDAARAAGTDLETFDAIEPNPRTTTAESAAERARAAGPGCVVVGLGGGSALDAAKAAAMLATNPGAATDFVGRNRFRETPLPFTAIPTTCGTGSEVTCVSVLSDAGARTKISLKGDGMFPTQALVDSEVLRTLPPSLVAATGADALTHALEATTCKVANPVSDALAETAIRLLFRFLPRATQDIDGDDEAREGVMRASTLAGIAFGNADVAAVHCLSEALGGIYDVPHGLTNAILLAPVLRYNQPYIDARLSALLAVIKPNNDYGGSAAERAENFLARLDALLEQIGIPAFGSLAVPSTGFDHVAACAEANGSNPSNARLLVADDYASILRSLD